jgi:hypothetical protein
MARRDGAVPFIPFMMCLENRPNNRTESRAARTHAFARTRVRPASSPSHGCCGPRSNEGYLTPGETELEPSVQMAAVIWRSAYTQVMS